MSYYFFCARVISGGVFLAMLLAATLFYGCAGWSTEDKVRQGVYTALHLADWAQTREIAEKPDEYHETNCALGDHPSKGEVDVYMGGTLIAHWVISDLLPTKWRVPLIDAQINPRAWWQSVTIGVEAACVVNNYSIGLRGDF